MPSSKIRHLLREHDDSLPVRVWPGGYPIYYVTRCTQVFCPDCAQLRLDEEELGLSEDYLVDYDTHLEGPPLTCDGCGDQIESAYGDPDE